MLEKYGVRRFVYFRVWFFYGDFFFLSHNFNLAGVQFSGEIYLSFNLFSFFLNGDRQLKAVTPDFPLSSVYNTWQTREREGMRESSAVYIIPEMDGIRVGKRAEKLQSRFSELAPLYLCWVRSEALPGRILSYYLRFVYNFAVPSCAGKLKVFRGASWPVLHRQPAITCRPTSVQRGFTCHGRCARQQARCVCKAGWQEAGRQACGEAGWQACG